MCFSFINHEVCSATISPRYGERSTETVFLIESTASRTLFRGRLTQVFCDSSVHMAAISTSVNLRNNDPDKPKPSDDRQNNEEIEDSGHRSTLPVEKVEQCQCRQDIEG
jgi:hypothetical protein